MSAKVLGSWHIHRLSEELTLDFLVLFSTGVSLLGSRGQSNHAAANGFVDGLAHYRQSLGLPAVSVNWGAWSGAGAAVDKDILDREDVESISPEEGLDALAYVMRTAKR